MPWIFKGPQPQPRPGVQILGAPIPKKPPAAPQRGEKQQGSHLQPQHSLSRTMRPLWHPEAPCSRCHPPAPPIREGRGNSGGKAAALRMRLCENMFRQVQRRSCNFAGGRSSCAMPACERRQVSAITPAQKCKRYKLGHVIRLGSTRGAAV